MSEVTREIIVDGRRFAVHFDPDSMRKTALGYQGLDEEAIECEGFNMSSEYGVTERPTPVQLEDCVKRMLKDIDDIEKDDAALIKLVKGPGKKKDGFFKKGSVYHYAWYNETSYPNEEWYGDFVMCIRAKADDAQNITVRLETDVVKW